MPDDLVDRIVDGMIDAWRDRATGIDGGEVLELDGLVLALTNLGADDQNVTLVEREPADPLAALGQAEAQFRTRGRQFGVKVVVGRTPSVESALRELGLQRILSEPVMAVAVSDVVRAPTPTGVVIERARKAEDLSAAIDLEIEVFGTKRPIAEALLPPAMADHPKMRAYVARLDGRPAAGAQARRDGRTVGVFGVGTIERARRRGIGAALASFVVMDHGEVADVAWLESSDLGLPVYERLGFGAIARSEVWVRRRRGAEGIV